MKTIGLMKNTVQHYAWGSATAIPELLGEENPSHKPWAELWMGAHPKAPSLVNFEGQWVALDKLIEIHPQDILGQKVAARFQNKLPYLFKVLAAAKPLSVQAHPEREQAHLGFEAENSRGLPADALNRNYKDENHKPECICALTGFWALHGFRNIDDIVTMLTICCPTGLAAELDQLRPRPNAQSLKQFYSQLMQMDSERQKRIIDETLHNMHRLPETDAVFWMKRLSEEYPSDIGILSPILLNLICLQPGQALFLPARELHAYLEGTGIELMANSDNVLRGGLTPKNIDVAELLKVVRFEPRTINTLKCVYESANEKVYVSPADEFVLSWINVSDGSSYQSSASRSVEILLCTTGEAYIQEAGTHKILKMKKGQSVLVPAKANRYRISGTAAVYKAAVPV
jgi:mannose-6-phosphate isomerase